MHENSDSYTENKSKFSNILDGVSEILGKISGYAVLIMVAIVTFNVITRKLINWSIPGFYEIIGLIGAVLYAFGIVYAAIKGQHIVMDLVVNRFPKKIRNISNIFMRLMVLVFCCLFAYAGYGMAIELIQEKTFDVRIPVAPFRFLVVIAFVILALLIISGRNIGKGGDE